MVIQIRADCLVETYTLIYSIFILVCALLLFFDDFFYNTLIQDKIILLILVIITSLIAAFRPLDSSDTNMYVLAYDRSISIVQNVKFSNFNSIFANRQYYSIELGFIIYMSFFRHFCGYRVFFFLNSVISNLLIIYGLNLLKEYAVSNDDVDLIGKNKNVAKGKPGIISLFSMYMLMCGVLYSSVTIRAALSLGLGLTFIGYTLKDGRRIIYSFLLALASLLIHTTGVVFIAILILILLGRAKIKAIVIKVLWVLLALLYFGNIARYTINGFLKFKDFLFNLLNIGAFSSYFTEIEYAIQMREGMIVIICGLILAFIYQKSRINSIFSVLVLIGIGLFTFAYPVHAMSRLADYFIVFLIPMAGYSALYEDYRKNMITKIMFALLYLPQYVMIFTRN